MCPTICANERIIVDIAADKNGGPHHGDVIMLRTKFSDALFIKRVIAVGGDTVKQGTAGEILVNGNPLSPISICGRPETGGQSEGEEDIKFDAVKVPENSFFVVGDNLKNSLDSRTQEFGYVTSDQIRGTPLHLYWSPVFSRIGCKVR
jgi:signal peptidase I